MSETTGLTTNNLLDGVVKEAQDTGSKAKNGTVFEIALEIDSKVKEFMQDLENNDREIANRMDKISKEIGKIRSKT